MTDQPAALLAALRVELDDPEIYELLNARAVELTGKQLHQLPIGELRAVLKGMRDALGAVLASPPHHPDPVRRSPWLSGPRRRHQPPTSKEC
jgi:hypothetical protein